MTEKVLVLYLQAHFHTENEAWKRCISQPIQKTQAILKKWNERGIISHFILKSEVLFALVAVSHIFMKTFKPRNKLYFVYYLRLQRF